MMELLLSFISTSRKTEQCKDGQNGGAVNIHENKRGGWSEQDQAVAAGKVPAPCPCVQDGMGSSDSAQGEWQEQTLPEILAIK